MDRMLASVMKEWRLLTRDRAGLLMLFLMPSLLVIVVSVVQPTSGVQVSTSTRTAGCGA